MGASNSLSETEVAAGLEEALQETNHHRELDSLETIIVRAWFTAHHIECDGSSGPKENTVAGWIQWAKSFENG